MQNNFSIDNLCEKIKKREVISPFLFLNNNQDLLNSQVTDICIKILNKLNVPKTYLFKLEDDGSKIKIKTLKSFLEKSDLKATFTCQIFFIENIGRFTLSASNTCLKFFEEPGIGNIIILTNPSESQVLDTILSRVIQVNNTYHNFIKNNNNFYFSLIDNFLNKNDNLIFSYFFNEKLEKDEYILFLENIILYSKEFKVFNNILFSIEKDINHIKNNNVSSKYVIDKILIQINLEK